MTKAKRKKNLKPKHKPETLNLKINLKPKI